MPIDIGGKAYLFVSEVAERSGLAPITVRRYAKAGKIPYFQPGGEKARLLFPADCIEQSAGRFTDQAGADAHRPGKEKLAGRRPKWLTDPTSD